MPKVETYRVNLPSIERRLPAGFALPRAFGELADWCGKRARGSLGWFRLEGTSPDDLVRAKVGAALVPFMVLPDGGFVAFWFEGGKPPPIVWLDSEGQSGVAGASFDDFLRRLVERKTGVEDLDDQEGGGPEEAETPAAWRRARSTKALAPIRTAFRRWLRDKEPKPEKVSRARAEEVRAALAEACQRYWKGKPEHLRWVNFVVTLDDHRYDARWFDGGLKPLPDAERMRPCFVALRDLRGKPLKDLKVKVLGDGTVFFGDSALELPKKKPR
ncbi:MAG TPA: hypothetical protein PLU22_01230 [Polyangiaceae bacterium]|nr:hypothetical protein [Polyangiaceae bacterium]